VLKLEPSLDLDIVRALGLGLVLANPQGRIGLTDLGRSIAGDVESNAELFTAERELLRSLPRSLSQATVRNALAQRRMP
jgi:hypothetical protein